MRYAWAMKRSTRVIAAALVLLVLAPAVVSAQDSGIGEWIRRTGAHRVGGYVTMGLAVTTAAMGLLGYEVHPYLGYTTAAFAAGAALARHPRLRRLARDGLAPRRAKWPCSRGLQPQCLPF
jgi:hypothetical protein